MSKPSTEFNCALCGRPEVKARGLCGACWQRCSRNGTLNKYKPTRVLDVLRAKLAEAQAAAKPVPAQPEATDILKAFKAELERIAVEAARPAKLACPNCGMNVTLSEFAKRAARLTTTAEGGRL